jgi:hypothetical protein
MVRFLPLERIMCSSHQYIEWVKAYCIIKS